jgi:hypothetical protein
MQNVDPMPDAVRSDSGSVDATQVELAQAAACNKGAL